MISTLARKKAIVREELREMKRTIKREYPDAVFRVIDGPEASPRSLWMDVYSDLADREILTDLVIEQGLELLEKKRFLLTVHAIPLDYLPAPRTHRASNGNRATRERRASYRVKRVARKERKST